MSKGILNCKTADVYWTMMTELATPVVEALTKADQATQQKIKNEVYEVLNQRYPDGNVQISSNALVICGQK